MKLTPLCLAFVIALMSNDCVHGQLLKNLFGGSDSNQSTPLGMEPSALGQADNVVGQQKFQLPSLPSLFKPTGSSRQHNGAKWLGQSFQPGPDSSAAIVSSSQPVESIQRQVQRDDRSHYRLGSD